MRRGLGHQFGLLIFSNLLLKSLMQNQDISSKIAWKLLRFFYLNQSCIIKTQLSYIYVFEQSEGLLSVITVIFKQRHICTIARLG